MSEGKVYLVGAGPGDPGLLTIKGLRLIQSADVIAYDRLVDTRLLAHARCDAELIDVGKIPGSRTQNEINILLIDCAREGKKVVRLKGGDPLVFGRGGEEAQALNDAGVKFEIVPGVTSAIAAPAYAGIPLTHRDHASSFTVVTGSAAPNGRPDGIDWHALAAVRGTLVFLMAWRNLDDIVSQLIAAGKPAGTPAAIVSWGTQPWQRTVEGRLDSIAESAKSSGLRPPAALVIGSVVGMRESLGWFENAPPIRQESPRHPHQDPGWDALSPARRVGRLPHRGPGNRREAAARLSRSAPGSGDSRQIRLDSLHQLQRHSGQSWRDSAT